MTSLTDEEKRQIREYGRIHRIYLEVLSGTHPRLKIPAHLRPAAPPAPPSSAARPEPVAVNPPTIIITAPSTKAPSLPPTPIAAPALLRPNPNHYSTLGVGKHVGPASIERAFRHKERVHSRSSRTTKGKWTSKQLSVRRKAERTWDIVLKAYRVLGDPVLRKEYDVEMAAGKEVEPRGARKEAGAPGLSRKEVLQRQIDELDRQKEVLLEEESQDIREMLRATMARRDEILL